MNVRAILPALAACVIGASFAGASEFSSSSTYGSSGGYSPQVPVSSFARTAKWFDPSRLHVTAEMNVGSGGYGGGTTGLQVTRFDYRFGAPLAMRVSVGNAFGSNVQNNGQFFLEGLDVAYQPFKSLTIQVNYRDIRSPLQYGNAYGYGPWGQFASRSWFERSNPLELTSP